MPASTETLEYGLIFTPPTVIDGARGFFGNMFDPQELRFALLFWDQLAWPANNLIDVQANDAESIYLTNEGVLIRPHVYVPSSSGTLGPIGQSYLHAYLELDKREPGKWSLSQGHRSLLFLDGPPAPARAMLVELFNAIPIPDKEVPLQEILEFKARRRVELRQLHRAITELHIKLQVSTDRELTLKLLKEEIRDACNDVLDAAKASRQPFRLSNWKISFSTDVRSLVIGFGGAEWMENFWLGALAGAASTIKISHDLLPNKVKPREHPYHYVAEFRDEVFGN